MNIHTIDIYCTPYVYNIAYSLKNILIEMKISCNLFCRSITSEDINRCSNNNNLYMFLFCPQWIYNKDSGILPINKYFFYQLEQFDKSNSPHIKNNFVLDLMNKSKHIFDYSTVNLDYYTIAPFNLPKHQFSHLIPAIPDIYNNNKKDIDVLFVGCLNSRRQQILSIIKQSNINLIIPKNCFGNNLSNLISRSKIFLNIRFSDSKILETCRLHEALMSTNTFIVSEKPASDIEKEYIKIYKNKIKFINEITNDCSELVQMLKIILSDYDNSKHISFDKTEINGKIKNVLVNAFYSFNPFITFIMPSINHPNINIAIKSLLNQTIQNWKLIIVFDCIDDNLINISNDPRITYINLKEKKGAKNKNGNAGLVRNMAFPLVNSEWIGYLDDDDALDERYISNLIDEIGLKNDLECVLFRLYFKDHPWKNYKYVPINNIEDIILNNCPISFCHKNFNVNFVNSDGEDYIYMKQLKTLGKKICISPFVNYYVHQINPDTKPPTLNRSYINNC